MLSHHDSFNYTGHEPHRARPAPGISRGAAARPRRPWSGARRPVLPVAIATFVFTAAPLPSCGQAPPEGGAAHRDPWGPFRVLIGTWEASIDGALGQGQGRRTYELVFGDRYLIHRHASVRPPQPSSPEGDHHREMGVYSFDRERGVVVLREFMEEGFVLRSTCDVEPTRFVCTSEHVESGPGMRSRLTIEIESAHRFVELFELAGPGEELTLLFNNTWTRIPHVPGLP